MDTFETVIFNRSRLMQVTTCLMATLTMGLLALMIWYCSKKIIIVTDYEDSSSTNLITQSSHSDVVWKIKTDIKKAEGIHIPVTSLDFEYDTDYVNNIFVFQIPESKGKYYMENMPYGDFSGIKSATGRYDGEVVTYSFSMDSCLEATAEVINDEVVFSFAPISHDKPIVLLDPGHGGNSAGNMAGDTMEKDVTLNVARRVSALAKDKNYKILLTRNLDRKIGTGECISIVNVAQADYYIALHLDADLEDTKTFGIRASYNADYYRNDFENVDFADSLLKNVALSTSNRAIELAKAGDEELTLKVLKIPATVMYLGYLSNSSEAALLANDEYIEKIAQGIINSLDENIK